MTKTTSQRTFTGCWTCRRRNIRCDTVAPSCSQCARSHIQCEGYHIRLVWVDSSSGDYPPLQRRSYPCHQTWRGYPHWTLKEVAHLIEYSEQGGKCRCRVHNATNPFLVFSQHEDSYGSPKSDCLDTSADSSVSPSSRDGNSPWTFEDSTVVDGTLGGTTAPEYNTPPASSLQEERDCSLIELVASSRLFAGDNEATGDVIVRDAAGMLISWMHPAASAFLCSPGFDRHLDGLGNGEERRLFHHYVTTTSMSMVPVDDIHNPWKSTYPSIAAESTYSSSASSLYHAMLAQSAYHLANLKDGDRARGEKARAVRHYGVALRELRRSLIRPIDEYCRILAALITIALAEHVFRGEAPGWQLHFKAAEEFVCQYADTRPWTQSNEAWTVTQNFALEFLISQTTTECFPHPPTGLTSKLRNVLNELMREPGFGYTHGGTAHIFRALHQVRCFEEQLCSGGHNAPDIVSISHEHQPQLEAIIQQLQTPISDQVEIYIQHRQFHGVTISLSMHQLIQLHLQLFTEAVMIYLMGTVLRYPPSAVHEKVTSALIATTKYIELQHGAGSFSIWPVFIAALHAHTPEAKALATHCLSAAETMGAGNRGDVHRVVRMVWLERQRIARVLGCDEGLVYVNWRGVMKRINADILLL